MAEATATWRAWLARARLVSRWWAKRISTNALIDMVGQKTPWRLDPETGDLVNPRREFMDGAALAYYVDEYAQGPLYATPIFGCEQQEPGIVVLFADSTMDHVIVQAKFGGGNPGADLNDPQRAAKKGVLVAPTFQASMSNLKVGVGAVGRAGFVQQALLENRVSAVQVSQDENRFLGKSNKICVIALSPAE